MLTASVPRRLAKEQALNSTKIPWKPNRIGWHKAARKSFGAHCEGAREAFSPSHCTPQGCSFRAAAVQQTSMSCTFEAACAQGITMTECIRMSLAITVSRGLACRKSQRSSSLKCLRPTIAHSRAVTLEETHDIARLSQA